MEKDIESERGIKKRTAELKINRPTEVNLPETSEGIFISQFFVCVCVCGWGCGGVCVCVCVCVSYFSLPVRLATHYFSICIQPVIRH